MIKQNTILVGPLTQEELYQVNILNPVVCTKHNKSVTLYYKDDKFKLNYCCDELIKLVRLDASKRMSKFHQEQ